MPVVTHAFLRTRSTAGAIRRPQRLTVLVLGYNLALLLWLALHPAGHTVTAQVDDVAQFVGPGLMGALCLLSNRGEDRRRARAAACLGLGALCFALGQAIWTVYELILRQSTPFPSWADAAFLAAYPFLLAGILLLPADNAGARRGRAVLDGLIVMTAVATFSWYFVLGPTLMQEGESALAKIVGTAYPASDLVLFACVLVLILRGAGGSIRQAAPLLAAGLAAVITIDSVFDYTTLHGIYATGGPIDVGWPLGYMLIALAGCRLRAEREVEEPAASAERIEAPTSTWLLLVPYAVLLPVAGLLAYSWHNSDSLHLEYGLDILGTGLILLVILRQVFVILEKQDLYARLHANHAELAGANQRLAALATTDPLTDLLNHRALMSAVDQELDRAARYRRPCSLIVLDLDHFKSLNDTFGHTAGDTTLCEVAQVLKHTLRSIDLLGRWGGEEFVVILPEIDRDSALLTAERLRAAVAGHRFSAGSGAHVTCSLGVATYPHDGEARDVLLERADEALYAAKRLGRNQARGTGDPAVVALARAEAGPEAREDGTLAGTVEALASLVEVRDAYTGRHGQDVAMLSMRLAAALGLTPADARRVGMAARLHDVGKVGVPDAILRKPGPLGAEEWTLMHAHPGVSADVVSRVPHLRPLAATLRAHHERWDGRGYPDRLRGRQIPLAARILAACDAYGAMTTTRPYRERISPEAAITELRRCAGTQFDPDVVEALVRMLEADGAVEIDRAG